MAFIGITAAAALIGFILGLSLAGRIAEHIIEEMRLEAGLDIHGDDSGEGDK